MRTPMARRNACVRASVLDISNEKTSDAVRLTNGTSVPRVCAIPDVSQILQQAPTHGNGSLACTRRTGDEDGAASNPPFLHHLEDDAGSLARLALADHSLRRVTRLEVGIEAQSVDVRVRACRQSRTGMVAHQCAPSSSRPSSTPMAEWRCSRPDVSYDPSERVVRTIVLAASRG